MDAKPVLNETYILPFGKYKGKSLLEIANLNPSYIKWLSQNSVLEIPDSILILASNHITSLDIEDLHSDWGCRD
jgi:hypothetical protein